MREEEEGHENIDQNLCSGWLIILRAAGIQPCLAWAAFNRRCASGFQIFSEFLFALLCGAYAKRIVSSVEKSAVEMDNVGSQWCCCDEV